MSTRYVCHNCGKGYSARRSLDAHLKIGRCELKKDETYICPDPDCALPFRACADFEAHLKAPWHPTGPTAPRPESPDEGDIWGDPISGRLYVYASGSWIEWSGSGGSEIAPAKPRVAISSIPKSITIATDRGINRVLNGDEIVSVTLETEDEVTYFGDPKVLMVPRSRPTHIIEMGDGEEIRGYIIEADYGSSHFITTTTTVFSVVDEAWPYVHDMMMEDRLPLFLTAVTLGKAVRVRWNPKIGGHAEWVQNLIVTAAGNNALL